MDWFIKLFTHAEWTSIIVLIILTFSTTELAKRLQRRLFKRYKKTEVWFLAFTSGFFWSYIVWPESAIHAEWYIPAMIIGPVTATLHRVAIGWLKVKYPEAHASITGDRRAITRKERKK